MVPLHDLDESHLEAVAAGLSKSSSSPALNRLATASQAPYFFAAKLRAAVYGVQQQPGIAPATAAQASGGCAGGMCRKSR